MKRPSLSYKILIVDDMPAVREALRWRLEDEPDLTVVGEAGDGQSALDLAAQSEPDVVILDIELPDQDGYAVARRLKARLRPPRVIFLTVHGDPLSRQRAAAAGADGFVEKGAGWPALIAQIRRGLANQPSTRLGN